MSGSRQTKDGDSRVETVDKARQGIEQVEAGEAAGVNEIDQAKSADPAGAEAVEQEASDGPPGRGLSR